MKQKLFDMPMVRAYTITAAFSTLPTVIMAFAVLLYVRGYGSTTDAVKSQIAAAKTSGGAVAASEIQARAEFPNIVPWWILLCAVMFILSGAIIRIFLGSNTIDTANSIVEESRVAAGGDLRVEPTVSSKNEYGALQAALLALIRSFRETVSRIDRAAVDLKLAAAEMAHTADEAGNAIGEVAEAIGAINQGASHQVSLVSYSAELVGGIEGSVRGASKHAGEASRQSADTERLAQEGVQCAAEVEEAMQAVRKSSLGTAHVIRSLGEKFADIDQIVQAITDIAGQTNMLALNASIEAARAGEQGKGFRNVADEVRLLAEDAQSSAEEIAVLVREIQNQTAQAVQAMENGVERVEEGFDTVNRNRQTFSDIGSAVRALSESSAEISELARGIETGTDRVRGQIEQVAAVAEQSSASTQEVSASTEETSAAAEEVSASAQRVAQTATVLAELSSRFTLPGQEARDAA